MMILVGQFDSPFVRRVAATMNHYGMPFDRHVLSAFGDKADLARLNPLGKVPALIVGDDDIVFDSAAILDYLDSLVDASVALTPRDGKERRHVIRLATVAAGLSDRAVQLRTETVRRPAQLQNPAFVDDYHAAIRGSLDYLEAQCVGPWMLGEAASQADFSVTATLTHLSARVSEYADLRPWPKIADVRTAGEALPAFAEAPFVEG